ncbi:MAG: zinc ribbon domain-containing protein [Candidatus Bathyarchaeota archaeon]|nr:MAG: zinc ribbon domain-containing protein [Candidatus Bathyarchaeota archaeon]
MVYCTRCGTRNSIETEFCIKCGAHLFKRKNVIDELTETMGHGTTQCFGSARSVENTCFGVRRIGEILGLIVGIFIILWGISILLREPIWQWIGPYFVMVIGLLIIARSLSRVLRKPS